MFVRILEELVAVVSSVWQLRVGSLEVQGFGWLWFQGWRCQFSRLASFRVQVLGSTARGHVSGTASDALVRTSQSQQACLQCV